MNKDNPAEITWQEYCTSCKNYDQSLGTCSVIHENVRSYPKKFISKCSGRFYEKDEDKKKKLIEEREKATQDLEREINQDVKVRDEMSLSKILFSFEGRISRSEYWGKAFPILFGYGILVNLISYAEAEATGSPGISIILSLISLWPGFAVLVKRLHDRDHSGSFALTLLIPFINIVFAIWILIEVWFLKGTEGENRFGPDPIA